MKIISIGCNCNARTFIKDNFNMESYPFDWLITNIDFLINVFETSSFDFCNIENLYYNFTNETIHIRNKNNSALSIHDMEGLNQQQFKQQIPIVNEKYERRLKRLYDVLNSNEEVLLIRQILEKQSSVNQVDDSTEKLNYLSNLLKKNSIKI